MAGNKQPIFQLAPKTTTMDLDNSDGIALEDLYIAGTNGSLIDNISVISTDTAEVVLVLTINDGTDDFQIGAVAIPTLSGTNGSSPSVNLLDSTLLPFLQSGGGLPLAPNMTLKINATSAVTALKVVNIVAYGGDY